MFYQVANPITATVPPRHLLEHRDMHVFYPNQKEAPNKFMSIGQTWANLLPTVTIYNTKRCPVPFLWHAYGCMGAPCMGNLVENSPHVVTDGSPWQKHMVGAPQAPLRDKRQQTVDGRQCPVGRLATVPRGITSHGPQAWWTGRPLAW